MRIAYIVFDGITWLDFIGIYDPVSRLKSMQYLPDLSWDICAFAAPAKDNFGLEIKIDKVRPSLADYDAVVIPGGFGTRKLLHDEDFLAWIKTSDPRSYKISVCTGSLILGAAGFLTNKKATTHFREFDTLARYCRQVVDERVVEDGDVITAGAVSSSIDLGLYLCGKWAGDVAQTVIRESMAYRG